MATTTKRAFLTSISPPSASSKRELSYLESDLGSSDDEDLEDTKSEVHTEIADLERESTIAQQERYTK